MTTVPLDGDEIVFEIGVERRMQARDSRLTLFTPLALVKTAYVYVVP